MPLTKLVFRPGINRDIPHYIGEGGWFHGNRVRFRAGLPEPIGGWTAYSDKFFLGSCRALFPWTALDNTNYLGVGTHLKYYVEDGAVMYDITPIRTTSTAGAVTFSAAANTLSGDIAADATTLTLTSSTGFPESGLIKINSEQIRYSSVNGSDLEGLTRGVNGTTAAAHSSTDTVTCATLTVAHTSHGATIEDFVTYSGAATLGSQITAGILNQEYQIVSIVDSDTYLIEARTIADVADITGTDGLAVTPVFADASDSGNGGAAVVGTYQINVGRDTSVFGTGWGTGTWGTGTWGTARSSTSSGAELRVWTHDNFGEDLLLNVRNGGIYYWDKSGGTGARAVELSSLSGANTTPTVATQILVSDQDRHIIALGADSETSPGTQDPLLIRFSDQESLTEWAAEATNTAGELRLGIGSRIVCGVETRQQVLVYTDVSLHALQYLGPPFTYGVNTLSNNISIIGPKAVVAAGDAVFWMGKGNFYRYAGDVAQIPCPVREFVFNDFNSSESHKVAAGHNGEHSEVWWMYPSESSDENDRYVAYDYLENVWHYGALSRTAWIDRGTREFPLAASSDHALYYHETGTSDGSINPPTSLNAYVESAQIDLSDGNNFAFIRRILPDVSFSGSTAQNPSLTHALKAWRSSGSLATSEWSGTVTREDTEDPYEKYTGQLHLRLRGRAFSFYVGHTDAGTTWRYGAPRVDVRMDGRQ